MPSDTHMGGGKGGRMHGLINKAVETFVRASYGADIWRQVAVRADLAEPSFEAMLVYEAEITTRIVDASVDVLGADRTDFLQNLGNFLVTHSSGQRVRRLLRFGGVTFIDFLYSLDDLRDRARLAVADIDLPELELREHTSKQFSLTIKTPLDGFGHVIAGLLTAMADDYGALVMLEHGGRSGNIETIAIVLLETSFAEGNTFDLGQVHA